MENATIKGWLVRDKDDFMSIYATKPIRGKTEWIDGNHPKLACESSCILTFQEYMFPDVTFEDEPIEVEIAIKPMNTYNSPTYSEKQEQPNVDIKSPFTDGEVILLSRDEEVTFRGEKIKITRKYYRCVDTGREFTDSKLDDDMMWAALRAYCEKKGMTSFKDITLRQEHLEIDFEKEVNEYIKKNFTITDEIAAIPEKDRMYSMGSDDLLYLAYYFIRLGLNARKEK